MPPTEGGGAAEGVVAVAAPPPPPPPPPATSVYRVRRLVGLLRAVNCALHDEHSVPLVAQVFRALEAYVRSGVDHAQLREVERRNCLEDVHGMWCESIDAVQSAPEQEQLLPLRYQLHLEIALRCFEEPTLQLRIHGLQEMKRCLKKCYDYHNCQVLEFTRRQNYEKNNQIHQQGYYMNPEVQNFQFDFSGTGRNLALPPPLSSFGLRRLLP